MSNLDYSFLTLGVEEEYMVIDSTTKELKSHEQKIVKEGQQLLGNKKVKAEMHRAVVEVGTDICRNIDEVYTDIYLLRHTIFDIAESIGLQVGASGTHPFSLWNTQLITDDSRYHQIIAELQDAARSNLIFGLHVHVGMKDRKMALQIANTARNYLPQVYALSANSPFWKGRKTGYKAFRSKVFDKFPRTGIPEYFETIEEYGNFVNLLIKTNSINDAKKIWWDLRVHPVFNTIEFRICDVTLTINEAIGITALLQALCAKLYKLHSNNIDSAKYQRSLINENKWRASRYGIDGKLIDFAKEKETDTKTLILELLDFVDDVIDELGSRNTIKHIEPILTNGTGADKQLLVYEKTNSLVSVVEYINQQFLA